MFLQIIIPISTFILSVTAFYFTLSNFLQKRANLKFSTVTSDIENNNELLVDRLDAENPDVYTDKPYRFIPTINLINNSSSPITIFEIRLHNQSVYNRFTRIGDTYQVTSKANQRTVNGVTWFNIGTHEESIYDVKDNSLELPLTLSSFEAATGCVVFSYKNELKGHATIYLKTSRGSFKYNVKVGKLLKSCVNE